MQENTTTELPVNKPHNHTKSVTIVMIVIVICVAVIVGIWFVYKQRKQSTKVITTECSSTTEGSILMQAANNLGNQQALKPIADKILQISRFEKDPNCLYILTSYYISTGDSNNAQHYYDMLEKISKSQPPIGLLTLNDGRGIAYLKGRIEFLKQLNTQAQQNFVGTGGNQ